MGLGYTVVAVVALSRLMVVAAPLLHLIRLKYKENLVINAFKELFVSKLIKKSYQISQHSKQDHTFISFDKLEL